MKFDEWFSQQYGKLPLSSDNRKKLIEQIKSGHNAKAALEYYDRLSEKYETARVAWQIKDADKK